MVIKTINSPVASIDLADRLETLGIAYSFADTGLIVDPKDYDTVISLLIDMEQEEEE